MAQARQTYNINIFFDHEVQYLMALFLTNPELYNEYMVYKDRQYYFFYAFRKFAANYYNFSEDECIYFASTRKEAAGEANICGGGGRRSNTYARYMKKQYKNCEQERETRIDTFAKKYGVSFAVGKDPRLFVGVTEIWNKLDKALEIVAASKWADAKEKSYSDASFETRIPEKLEKILIPLAIRNKVMQKLRNRRITGSLIQEVHNREDEDEELIPETNTAENRVKTGIVVVVPDGVDEDW